MLASFVSVPHVTLHRAERNQRAVLTQGHRSYENDYQRMAHNTYALENHLLVTQKSFKKMPNLRNKHKKQENKNKNLNSI